LPGRRKSTTYPVHESPGLPRRSSSRPAVKCREKLVDLVEGGLGQKPSLDHRKKPRGATIGGKLITFGKGSATGPGIRVEKW